MKKILACFLSFVMMLSLTGCGIYYNGDFAFNADEEPKASVKQLLPRHLTFEGETIDLKEESNADLQKEIAKLKTYGLEVEEVTEFVDGEEHFGFVSSGTIKKMMLAKTTSGEFGFATELNFLYNMSIDGEYFTIPIDEFPADESGFTIVQFTFDVAGELVEHKNAKADGNKAIVEIKDKFSPVKLKWRVNQDFIERNTPYMPLPNLKQVKAVSASYNSIKLTWENIPNETAYSVYYSANKNGTYTKLASVTTNNYTAKNKTTGKTYYFKVIPNKTLASTGNNLNNAKIVSCKPIPSTPIVTVKKKTKTSIKTTWKAVSGATGYQVFIKKGNGAYKLAKTTKSKSFTKTKLAKKKTYYIKVRAYRTVSGTKVPSNYSSGKKVKL